ncbi:MAG: hypothetical protein ACI93N_000517 [Flavobacteriaceae bacterium]|jgi:hypothetical protein
MTFKNSKIWALFILFAGKSENLCCLANSKNLTTGKLILSAVFFDHVNFYLLMQYLLPLLMI